MKYYQQQTKYTCGPAAMRMVLECLGIKKSEPELAKLLKTNKIHGTQPENFIVLAKKLGLKYLVQSQATVADLKKYRRQGWQIIVNYYYPPEKIGHYSVVKKIATEFIYFWDPDPYFGSNHKYSIMYFKKIWKCDPKYNPEKAWLIALKNNL